MARLNNTTSPRKRTEPRRVLQSPTKAGQGLSESPLTRDNNEGQWAMASETRSTKNSASGMSDLKGTSIIRKQSQKTGKNKKKGSGGDFPIFYDSDALVENEAEETEDERNSASPSSSPFSASSSSTGTCPSHDEKTKNPLKLARVNSLLLPLSQQVPSRRQTRKSELYDYAKENDPVEQVEEDDSVSSLTRSASDAPSRRSPVRRNTRQTPESPQFLTYRQRETEEEDPDDSEDNGFDSMDDFIVSDNEDVNFNNGSSGSETEEEKAPSPPPQPKRRLFRGRRPAPKPESESESESESEPESEPEEVEDAKKPREVPLYKEQSPTEDTMPPLRSDPKHTQLSQKSLNITDKLSDLNLEDNGSSCQLARELNDVVVELDSPSKEPVSELPKPQTPPSSPSKNNRLRSPAKDRIYIPPTPYRESVDAFWSQESTNDWVDQHSPHKSPNKLEQLLREFEDSDDENDHEKSLDIMPRNRGEVKKEPKTPSKTAQKKAEVEHKKALVARKKSFDDKKAAAAYDFLKVLDDAVTGGQVQEMVKETGGVHIIWSKNLQTTAGRATWKRVKITDGEHEYNSGKQHATIELAERIIDSEDRMINTLAHEYCHLTNNMISKVHNNPHGTSFKQWGLRCKQALQDHPVYTGRVEVTTKHNYQIDYKYVWTCVDCAQNYGRHSKSINPAKSRCGRCKGGLQQIKPKPRNISPAKKKPAGQGGPLSSVDRKAVDDVMQVLGGVSLH